MARFLSPEWMDELRKAAAGLVSAEQLSLQQVVTHADGSVTTYALCFGPEGLAVLPGGVERPAVTLSTDYETAAAINRGELSAQAALLAGRVRVRGDSGALTRNQSDLARAQECWEPLRRGTSY
jgi:putative sterol carrier protein